MANYRHSKRTSSGSYDYLRRASHDRWDPAAERSNYNTRPNVWSSGVNNTYDTYERITSPRAWTSGRRPKTYRRRVRTPEVVVDPSAIPDSDPDWHGPIVEELEESDTEETKSAFAKAGVSTTGPSQDPVRMDRDKGWKVPASRAAGENGDSKNTLSNATQSATTADTTSTKPDTRSSTRGTGSMERQANPALSSYRNSRTGTLAAHSLSPQMEKLRVNEATSQSTEKASPKTAPVISSATESTLEKKPIEPRSSEGQTSGASGQGTIRLPPPEGKSTPDDPPLTIPTKLARRQATVEDQPEDRENENNKQDSAPVKSSSHTQAKAASEKIVSHSQQGNEKGGCSSQARQSSIHSTTPTVPPSVPQPPAHSEAPWHSFAEQRQTYDTVEPRSEGSQTLQPAGSERLTVSSPGSAKTVFTKPTDTEAIARKSARFSKGKAVADKAVSLNPVGYALRSVDNADSKSFCEDLSPESETLNSSSEDEVSEEPDATAAEGAEEKDHKFTENSSEHEHRRRRHHRRRHREERTSTAPVSRLASLLQQQSGHYSTSVKFGTALLAHSSSTKSYHHRRRDSEREESQDIAAGQEVPKASGQTKPSKGRSRKPRSWFLT
ncbi:hypothetical protein BD324DRAFT_607304 [Kockovaella imperatae]|uniref:Uncharacterized protein n=1 Tax=Kockovaella imperatae TaxID=4999 RepID=A0A1Y1UQH1_9TREE|nr:hypothetical protein BD324DRAFT_607304 [Kockovaella imperatae]ORX40283.1 hypothetical protein BD324DRAFT_607304 [Kockovaella imperatae]